MGRYRVSLTYEVEVEAGHIAEAVSTARSGIERFQDPTDTRPKPVITGTHAVVVSEPAT